MEAVEKCVADGDDAAWSWECAFASGIIEQCAKIAEEASTRRIPASEYADLIRKFERLET